MVGSWITVYGTLRCGGCKRAKKFLAEERIQYYYVEVMQDADGLAFIERVTNSKQIVPIIACRFADERPGVFAAGDSRAGSSNQAASAEGEGAAAVEAETPPAPAGA